MFLSYEASTIDRLLLLLNDAKTLTPSLRLITVLYIEESYIGICETRE
jgi:hypothetical protein